MVSEGSFEKMQEPRTTKKVEGSDLLASSETIETKESLTDAPNSSDMIK